MTLLTEKEQTIVRKHCFVYKDGIDALTHRIIESRNRGLWHRIHDEVKALLTEKEEKCRK
jgi:hypothetical protein